MIIQGIPGMGKTSNGNYYVNRVWGHRRKAKFNELILQSTLALYDICADVEDGWDLHGDVRKR